MSSRWGRVARGWVAAFFATVIALCSHRLAGGSNPGGLAILLSLGFSGLVCTALAGKTLSLTRQAIAVALSQFAFHAVFSLLSSVALPMSTATHNMHGMTPAHLDILNSTTAPTVMHATTAMWLGHAAAAMLTIAALRGGESAFWALIAEAQLVVRNLWMPRLAPPALPPVATSTAREIALVPHHRLTLLLSALRHRGPPRAPVFAH